MDRNPYEVLGIKEGAPIDEIKKAYRKKARENHPDTNPNDPRASERMNEINVAYDMIINPEKHAGRTSSHASSARSSAGAGYAGAGGYSDSGRRQESYTRPGQGGYYGTNQGYGEQRGTQTQDPYGWSGGINLEDLFGFGWEGQQSAQIHPEVPANDSAAIRQAIESINTQRFEQANALLRSIPSGNRDARWYYLSALSHKGTGNLLSA